jgi:hypothetical protein
MQRTSKAADSLHRLGAAIAPVLLGGLQTIGPIGVVLHSWRSINRSAGEELVFGDDGRQRPL